MDNLLSAFAAKENKRFKLKVGVFAVLMKDKTVLLLRRFQTGIGDGKYVLPMGSHDGKEPLTSSLIREVKEELNLNIQPEHISVCHVMHRFQPMPSELSFEQIDVFFQIHQYEGVIRNNETDRCDEVAFFPLTQLPPTTALFIRHALTCIEKRVFFSEFGFSINPEE